MRPVKEAHVNIHGKQFVIASDDDYLETMKNGFEPHMDKLFSTLIKPQDVVLDVGANVGCTGILFGGLAQSVYAFEPSPTTFSFLERNIANSGLKNVFPQNMALGEDAGSFTLTLAPSNRAGAYVSDKTQASAGHLIENIVVRKADDVSAALNIPKVDFVKIDVEGFEGQVIRGARRILEDQKPLVVLELNHWCLNAFQRTSIPEFFDFLRSVFPILYAVDGSGYLDLHNESDRYVVMYYHILHFRFANILAAFDQTRLDQFHTQFKHGFTP